MLSRCCNLTTLPLPFPLSFVSLDTHGKGIAKSSWLTDYWNNSCRYRLCDDHDARAMLALRWVLLLLLLRSGIGSRSAAWASRVDVVWVSVCVSSVVGWCSYVRWCCIRVALYASCMYPHLLCNVDVMISTLQSVPICGSILGGTFEFLLDRVAYWAWQQGTHQVRYIA